MKRIDALQIIDDVFAEYPVVVTCGATVRELASISRRDNHLPLLDSMGLTSAVGMGVAIASKRATCVIDGDGSFLMGFSIVPTMAAYHPNNLTVVVLDNGQHASASGIPSQASRFCLAKILAGFDLQVYDVEDSQALRSILQFELSSDRVAIVVVRIEQGNLPDIPLFLEDPAVLSRQFSDWLSELAR